MRGQISDLRNRRNPKRANSSTDATRILRASKVVNVTSVEEFKAS